MQWQSCPCFCVHLPLSTRVWLPVALVVLHQLGRPGFEVLSPACCVTLVQLTLNLGLSGPCLSDWTRAL